MQPKNPVTAPFRTPSGAHGGSPWTVVTEHRIAAAALGMALWGCGAEEPALYVTAEGPEEISASDDPVDLKVRVEGDAIYPVAIDVEPHTCPEGATCMASRGTFTQPAETHRVKDALYCDLVSDQAYWYRVDVRDDEGLTTQPAFVGFQCIP